MRGRGGGGGGVQVGGWVVGWFVRVGAGGVGPAKGGGWVGGGRWVGGVLGKVDVGRWL